MEEIKKIYLRRGRETLTIPQIKECITKTALIHQASKDEVIDNVKKYMNRNNYVGMQPIIWEEWRPTRVNRDILLESLHYDIVHFQSLNYVFSEEKPPDILRICTFNVHYWIASDGETYSFEEVVDVIKQINADVICLQEAVLPNSMKEGDKTESRDGWIERNIIGAFEKMNYKYKSWCATDNQNHNGPNSFFGNAIFSRYPILFGGGKDLLPKFKESRCYTYALIDIPQGEILVINTHLDVFDTSEKTRVEQIQQLLKDIGNANNVIICGDFNALRRKDYTDNEWEWLGKNNQGQPLRTKAIELMDHNFHEVFEDNQLKYTTWSARRVDYIWYRGDGLHRDRGAIYYSKHSDHFPVVADFRVNPETYTEPIPKGFKPVKTESTKGYFKCLLWTHNTPYELLYQMMTGESKRHIRCCSDDGSNIKRGAQFRYGLDSQYGDIMFVMEPGNWWRKLPGAEIVYGGESKATRHPVIGHMFREDLQSYEPDDKSVDKLLLKDAEMFTFRPYDSRGTGAECVEDEWIFTWCNLQLQLSVNVKLSKVKYVLAPRWIVSSDINIPEHDKLIRMLTNDMPKFPDGEINPLNGKFILYGPTDIKEHYQYFRTGSKTWMEKWYPTLDPEKYTSFGNTARNTKPYGNSSRLAISSIAFRDAEQRYMDMLKENGCKKSIVSTTLYPSGEKKTFLVYLVPKTQPSPQSELARIFGGYHATLFNDQLLPSEYNIGPTIESFVTGKRWTLPENSTLSHDGHNSYILFQSPTIEKLMDHLQKPDGAWDPENRGFPVINLGKVKDSRRLLGKLIKEDTWYVQLIEKIPRVKNPNPKNKRDYLWKWDPNQRFVLYDFD